MKPNGMRAWRKAHKAMRRRENRGRTEREGKMQPAARWSRRHWLDAPEHNAILTQRPVIEPRPFSPCSLVGMTHGARKRAARVEAEKELGASRIAGYAREYGSHLRSGEYLGAYATQRAKYRLGQRLRPCPGCESCLGRECIGCEGGQLFEGDVCERCGRTATGERICDGSGVLPAKRHRRCGWWLKTRTPKNATERCGMPMTGGGWVDCQHCGGSGWLPAGRA